MIWNIVHNEMVFLLKEFLGWSSGVVIEKINLGIVYKSMFFLQYGTYDFSQQKIIWDILYNYIVSLHHKR